MNELPDDVIIGARKQFYGLLDDLSVEKVTLVEIEAQKLKVEKSILGIKRRLRDLFSFFAEHGIEIEVDDEVVNDL